MMVERPNLTYHLPQIYISDKFNSVWDWKWNTTIAMNEADRLKALESYKMILVGEQALMINLTAQRIFAHSNCLVSLVDTHRQWFKSKFSVSNETPGKLAFCPMPFCNQMSRWLFQTQMRSDLLLTTGDIRPKHPVLCRSAPNPQGYALGTLWLTVTTTPAPASGGFADFKSPVVAQQVAS